MKGLPKSYPFLIPVCFLPGILFKIHRLKIHRPIFSIFVYNQSIQHLRSFQRRIN